MNSNYLTQADYHERRDGHSKYRHPYPSGSPHHYLRTTLSIGRIPTLPNPPTTRDTFPPNVILN
jgi:hypothetical protein